MAQNRWHVLAEGDAVTVTRRLPVRWDIACQARLPDAGRLRLAHQVRQDLWRCLRAQRGFAPVVRVAGSGDGVLVRAGGRIEGRFNRSGLEERIAGLLADTRRCARWVAHARMPRGTGL